MIIMDNICSGFRLPSVIQGADGRPRMVGFELEFSGLSLDQAADALLHSLGGKLVSETAAQRICCVETLGEFKVELDWDFLKRKAEETAKAEVEEKWIEKIGELAAILVPIEVVCPPVPITNMKALDPLVNALREAGAAGTEESLLAAYGVHINVELPSFDAKTLNAYIVAFSLLQWWLLEVEDVDLTRKATLYVAPYSEAYIGQVLSRQDPSWDQLMTDYLEFNASRNRALDLLPLFAEIDQDRVRKSVDDTKIKPRPALHYRLPNCHIEQPGWSLSRSWNSWWFVETLAHRQDDLKALSSEFLALHRPVLGTSKKHWIDFIHQWLEDRELA